MTETTVESIRQRVEAVQSDYPHSRAVHDVKFLLREHDRIAAALAAAQAAEIAMRSHLLKLSDCIVEWTHPENAEPGVILNPHMGQQYIWRIWHEAKAAAEAEKKTGVDLS